MIKTFENFTKDLEMEKISKQIEIDVKRNPDNYRDIEDGREGFYYIDEKEKDGEIYGCYKIEHNQYKVEYYFNNKDMSDGIHFIYDETEDDPESFIHNM